MPTLKVYRVSGHTAATLKVFKISGTATASTKQSLKVYRVTGTSTPQVTLRTIYDTPDLEPGTVVSQTAQLGTGNVGTPTWQWVQLSGKTVTLINPTSATVSFKVPACLPGEDTAIVLGVTATIGGVTSTQQTALFVSRPGTRFVSTGVGWAGRI